MKFALLLLVALPMVFCVEERNILDAFKHLFNTDQLHKTVTSIVNHVGSDATEAQCEKSCGTVVHAAVLKSGCPLVCKSFQSLVKHFGIHG